MKIGIDARLYGTKHGGIGRYTQELIKYLEQNVSREPKAGDQYLVFVSRDGFKDYQPQNPNFKKVKANFRVYSWQEQLIFPFLLWRHRLNLVHFTHFNAPIFYLGEFVVTIHDLIISHFPDSRATTLGPFKYLIKLKLYKVVVSHIAHKAQKIIAVSNFTKEDIAKQLKVNIAKIQTIYEGVDFSPAVEKSNCGKVLTDLGLNKRFLIYVGSAYPHKNLEKLVLAFQKIVREGADLQLALVGKKNFFYNQVEKFIAKGENLSGQPTKNIILTDYLEDDKLACLYQSANVYVFPSLIEGFGLPPLEAQHYGLPVVSSNATCLPEILGNSALYFDPSNVDDMAEKIKQLIDNEPLKMDLILKGQENLKRYSWDKTAKETLQVYENILSK